MNSPNACSTSPLDSQGIAETTVQSIDRLLKLSPLQAVEVGECRCSALTIVTSHGRQLTNHRRGRNLLRIELQEDGVLKVILRD